MGARALPERANASSSLLLCGPAQSGRPQGIYPNVVALEDEGLPAAAGSCRWRTGFGAGITNMDGVKAMARGAHLVKGDPTGCPGGVVATRRCGRQDASFLCYWPTI